MPNQNHLTSIDEELRILHSLPLEKRSEYIQELANTREPAIQKLLDKLVKLMFNEYGKEVSYIDQASAKLALAYFYLCYIYIKPSVTANANRYKMASLMELLIVKQQIMTHPDSFERQEINAIAGMCAAFSLINSMIRHDKEEIFYVDTRNKSVDDRMLEILHNHRVWLEMSGVSNSETSDDMPVFINSQFHELIEVLASVPVQIN